MICYTVTWGPFWLSDQTAFSNSEADVVWRVSRLLQWLPSRIFELNEFRDSESPYHPDVSNQVSAQSDLQFGKRCGLKNFKMAAMATIEDFQGGCLGGHLGYQDEIILAILNVHVAPMPSTMFRLNPTYRSGADNKLKIFKMAGVATSLDSLTKWF